jgi:hypothetical protein
VKYMWLRNLIDWKQVPLGGLFIVSHRYKSRTGVKT